MSESADNCRKSMQITQRIYPNTIVSSTSSGINHINARSWGNLVLSILKHRPTKYRGNDPATRKKFNRQKQNNDIVNHTVDEIFLQENNKVSDESETHENIESKLDDNDIYQIDNMRLNNKK